MKTLVFFILLLNSSLLFSQSYFGDKSLATFLKNNKTGIVLSWSPFMPLSVLAKEEIIEIGKELNVDILILLDPYAQASESDQVLTSNILVEAGMLNHFPSIALYKDHSLLSWSIQGYEQKESLKELIAQQLGLK